MGRPRACTGDTGREAFAAEERLHERIYAPVSMEVHPGTEEVIHLVRGYPGRQARDLTRAELADDTNRGAEIARARARATLAVYAGGAAAWVEANILIVARNLESPVFLGLDGTRCQQNKTDQNQ